MAKKNTAKKTNKKTKYYAVPVAGMIRTDTGDPMVTAVSVDDPEMIERLDASPAYIEVTKKEAQKIDAAAETTSFEDMHQQFFAEFNDLRGGPTERNAGDWVFAIVLLGVGFLAGAFLL